MISRMNSRADAPLLWCWRHPRAINASGRCIGHTDIAVDARKARRLAHHMRATVREYGLPREVWVSPLARCRDVGRVLAGWGYRVHVDARLMELHFGAWDGQPWSQIPWGEVQAWQDDLLHHAPGGVAQGECLAQLAQRVQAFVAEAQALGTPRLVVTHGGWLNALQKLPLLLPPAVALAVASWTAAPRHGALRCWPGGVSSPRACGSSHAGGGANAGCR
jgi:alpha-ribazole phosphatase